MKGTIKKIINNQWFVGGIFYLFGFLTTKTYGAIKEFNLLKQQNTHIDVANNMIVNYPEQKSWIFIILFFALLIIILFLFLEDIFSDD